MSESGVYRTTDDFLAEFVDPEDHATVKAGAARMIADHKASRSERISRARAKALRARMLRPTRHATVLLARGAAPAMVRSLIRTMHRWSE
ncbi:hypothetical protein M8Z33_07430 [Streptomyces sp. ZAF1911]|uniref:hypothetical protein n=1 Tax=Streptomyces sp. ZAF1911 TaxID=2944129 RepID=UPI00237B9493|nr:hypothetical protein [Streptomyces sp. ZAF1911]MDD9376505.1 hypothetical protein [Streptomyces sp. ZAF1911]